VYTLIIKRIIAALPLLLGISLFCFYLLKLLPGDPIEVLFGSAARDFSQEDIERLKGLYGLNKPWLEQYFNWLGGFIGAGDLGRSYRDGRPVIDVIGERIQATLMLAGCGLALAFPLGIAWGAFLAYLRIQNWGQKLFQIAKSLSTIAYCSPSFWLSALALSAIANAGLKLPLYSLANSFESKLVSMLLLAFILSLRRAAKVSMFLQNAIFELWHSEFILLAKAKGLNNLQIIYRHLIRNSLSPIIGLLGVSIPSLLAGSVLIENVFSCPGLGRLSVEATLGRNYPVIMALVLIYSFMVVIGNLISDLLLIWSNPQLADSVSTKGGE
jgi:peptide/nickel transport system permease protein